MSPVSLEYLDSIFTQVILTIGTTQELPFRQRCENAAKEILLRHVRRPMTRSVRTLYLTLLNLANSLEYS